jgi:hypothetical protein
MLYRSDEPRVGAFLTLLRRRLASCSRPVDARRWAKDRGEYRDAARAVAEINGAEPNVRLSKGPPTRRGIPSDHSSGCVIPWRRRKRIMVMRPKRITMPPAINRLIGISATLAQINCSPPRRSLYLDTSNGGNGGLTHGGHRDREAQAGERKA